MYTNSSCPFKFIINVFNIQGVVRSRYLLYNQVRPCSFFNICYFIVDENNCCVYFSYFVTSN